MPFALAAGYIVLLCVCFPHLIGWENLNSDISAEFVLTDAISHGHTGQVVLSTQGSWVPLWWGLLTRGLSFHRLLWELSPTLIMLVAVGLIAWSVSRIASRTAAALTAVLIMAASPTALLSFTAASFHNTTVPGAVLLGAYLVWLHTGAHDRRTVLASVVLISLVAGALLASDPLLGVVGLAPFALAPCLVALRTRDRSGLPAVLFVVAGTVAVSVVVSAVMHSLDFVTSTPGLRPAGAMMGTHLRWFVQGLLRMGNGLSFAPHAPWRAPLTIAAGVVTVAALVACARLAARTLIRPASDDSARARDLHIVFWAAAPICAGIAYVVTGIAAVPSDRYFVVAVPAVAAVLPMLLGDRRSDRVIAAGASIFIVASIVALAAGDNRYGTYRGVDARQAKSIEAVVAAHHLGVGYGGYWDAANLDWVTDERLRIYPITDVPGHVEPMGINRVTAWYALPARAPTYLLLAPGDNLLADRLPAGFPRPAREYHLGLVTLAAYPYNIAARFHPAAH